MKKFLSILTFAFFAALCFHTTSCDKLSGEESQRDTVYLSRHDTIFWQWIDTMGVQPPLTLSDGQVNLVAVPNNHNILSFSATAQTLTVNWGDGKVESFTLNGKPTSFLHRYTKLDIVPSVLISTTGLTDFSPENGLKQHIRFGRCTTLKRFWYMPSNSYPSNDCIDYIAVSYIDFGDSPNLDTIEIGNAGFSYARLNTDGCTNLKRIEADGAKNMELRLSKNTKLNSIDVSRGNYSASELNALFSQLPQRSASDNAIISAVMNPGYDACDKSIAESKGWATCTTCTVKVTGVMNKVNSLDYPDRQCNETWLAPMSLGAKDASVPGNKGGRYICE